MKNLILLVFKSYIDESTFRHKKNPPTISGGLVELTAFKAW
jgi:hypothetical protein